MRSAVPILIIAVLGSGCAQNPYAKHYTPVADPAYIDANRVSPPNAAPQLVPGSTPQQDLKSLNERGYTAIGFSHFSGKFAAQGKALEQARNVGADIVLVYDPAYLRTQTSAVPVALPTQQTYTTHSTATAYNSFGTTRAYANSYGQVSGQEWAMLPISIDQYDHFAAYFAKVEVPLGLYLRAPNEQEVVVAGTQRAVTVEAVVRGSDAFLADILPGDIIIKADGLTVDQIESAASFAASREGKSIDVEVIRQGAHMTKRLAVR